MAKEKNYGFKTPVRRSTNNLTGHKVVGQYSGAHVKVVRMKKIDIENKYLFQQQLCAGNASSLFTMELCVAAIGGYFLASQEMNLRLAIDVEGKVSIKDITLSPGVFVKVGIEDSFNPTKVHPDSEVKFTFMITSDNPVSLQFTEFGFGFVEYKYLKETDAYDDFYNTKKFICFPEQFYFTEEIELPESVDGDPIILKSCNRCQRFLPINHLNERQQLAFSNHCVANAPCAHSGFSRYQVIESALNKNELTDFIANTVFKIDGELIVSHHGHQLECKACKKFFVNAPLNPLRTSSQHREDALRRRAFERLINLLMGNEWVYHTFRMEENAEFDEFIWKKFGKKCFNCQKPLATPKKMHLDHTMPLVYLYPLDETATCLCDACNSLKSDMFPVDFYTPEQLALLSEITKIPSEIINSRKANQAVVDAVRKNITWFFEEFLTFEEYTKERDGKRAADSILHSLQKVIGHSEYPFDLVKEYSGDENLNA